MSNIHLIGIGGAGLSAIATVLHQQGCIVSGSDMQDSASIERLRRMGITVHIGHRAENLGEPKVVVISSAIPAHNPEVIAAQARNIPVIKRPAWLGQMMAGKRGITIAGAHGKTTTTAMITSILSRADLSPTYIIGGYVPQLKSNAAAGQSDLFVIEADEYDHTFLSLKPEIAVITNVERDHPDIYPSDELLFQAFVDFAALVPPNGKIIVCGDDSGVQTLLPQLNGAVTYGLDAENAWQAVNVKTNLKGSYTFDVQYQGEIVSPKPVALSVPGLHNVKNGLAALIVAHQLGVSWVESIHALSEFSGTERRFELKGEAGGVTVIDDYAHNPTEIKTTLKAARTRFGERPIWAVFQPHTFSRTKLLLEEFPGALALADHVAVLDIYPSREKDDGTISSMDIVVRMSHPDVSYVGSIDDAISCLERRVAPGDVVITLGAGDGYQIGEALLQKLGH